MTTQHTHLSKTRLSLACLIILLPLLTVAGCGKSEPKVNPTVTYTETAPDAATQSDITEALNQYEGYWFTLRDGSKMPVDEKNSRLRQYVTERKLEDANKFINDMSKHGQKAYGAFISRPKVVSATRTTIKFYDCQDMAAVRVVDKNGNQISYKVTELPSRVDMVKVDNVWKVDDTEKEPLACSGK